MSTAVERRVLARCWCGNDDLHEYGGDYRLCPRCGTLVTSAPLAQDIDRVHDEQSDLYGANYFFERARAQSFPDLAERAHQDLSERCVHWLKALLAHRPPPAATLEMGCASGAFVGLLAAAGYAASGQDLSPAVTALAHEAFGVPVLTGTIEDQGLEAGSIDVLILMDVVEHLRDPVATLSAALRALRDDGVVLIQMPCFDPALTYAQLRSANHAFLALLQPDEHLYLFSRASATQMLRGLGLGYVQFVPAFFDMYDLFLVASRRPMASVSQDEWRAALRRTRDGRIVEALIDAHDGARGRIALQQRLDQVEEDRARRLDVILSQQRELDALRGQVARQTSWWARTRHRLAPIKRLVRGRAKEPQ
jgi:SAM-dependent methyltransferase